MGLGATFCLSFERKEGKTYVPSSDTSVCCTFPQGHVETSPDHCRFTHTHILCLPARQLTTSQSFLLALILFQQLRTSLGPSLRHYRPTLVVRHTCHSGLSPISRPNSQFNGSGYMGRRLYFLGHRHSDRLWLGCLGIAPGLGISSASHRLARSIGHRVRYLQPGHRRKCAAQTFSFGVTTKGSSVHSTKVVRAISRSTPRYDESEHILDTFHMHISLVYVTSTSNLADPISRGVFPSSS